MMTRFSGSAAHLPLLYYSLAVEDSRPFPVLTMRLRFTKPKFDGEMTALGKRAEALARSFQHDYVGVEHYFLCFRDLAPDHPVMKVLSATKLDLTSFWRELEDKAKVVTGRPVPDSLPLTPRAEAVMDLAISFAQFEEVGETCVLHFLFAVAHERGSLPAALFAQQYVSQFSEYDGYELMATQFIGFACFDSRSYLAFPHAPKTDS